MRYADLARQKKLEAPKPSAAEIQPTRQDAERDAKLEELRQELEAAKAAFSASAHRPNEKGDAPARTGKKKTNHSGKKSEYDTGTTTASETEVERHRTKGKNKSTSETSVTEYSTCVEDIQ